MEEVATSNLMVSMASMSRSILREEALAAWRFQPSETAKDHDTNAAWIFEASQRDMEIVTRALERELNSKPDKVVINIIASNGKNAGPSTSEVPSSSISSCDPGSPNSQASVEGEATSATVEVSDSMASQFEAPRTQTPPAEALSRSCNNQRSMPLMNNFIGKKRSRRRNRAPITIMSADLADFQTKVQQMTGFPLERSNRAVPSPLKPRPKRPGRIGSNITPSAQPTRDSLSLGLPVAMNGLFSTRPNYLNPAAFRNNLGEYSVYSAGTASSISNSHCNSMAIHDKANTLQSHINAFRHRDFWN